MDNISFDGQVAVVTGAGAGLGRSYALELARRGAQVVVNDVAGAEPGQQTDAEAVVADIVAAGGSAIANNDSVASREGGAALVSAAIDTYGRLDVLINNAGILRDSSFVKLEDKDLDDVLDVHLRGAFYVTQPAYRQMREQGYGRILFTTSASGLFGNFGQANYAAAKTGLLGLSSVVAIEGAKYNIKSNALAPFAFTQLTKQFLEQMADAADPAHVTALVLYLVSSASETTHETFFAGAGWFGRAFLGVTPGWAHSGDARATVEDVAAHLADIRAEEGYSVPLDADSAAASIIKRLSQ